MNGDSLLGGFSAHVAREYELVYRADDAFLRAQRSYHAPAIVTAIGRLHKNQVFAPVSARRPASGGGRAGSRTADSGPSAPPRQASLATLALKWAESLGLAATTLFGVWIGLTHAKRKRTLLALLGAGTLVPLLLSALSGIEP